MTTKLEENIHPEAVSSFNERAECLINALEVLPPRPPDDNRFRPEVHSSFHVTAEDLTGPIRLGLSNHKGEAVAAFFEEDKRFVGLRENTFKELRTICEGIRKHKPVRDQISLQCIIEKGLEWVRRRHLQIQVPSFVQFVLEECSKAVRDTEVWMPIWRLHLQSELSVGVVVFKTITKQMLDEHHAAIRARLKKEEQGVEEVLKSERRELQGTAAATIRVKAEPKRAHERAGEEAEKALAALRIFHPSAIIPDMKSYCTLLGKENLERFTSLLVENDKIVASTKGLVDQRGDAWILNDVEISQIRGCGLDSCGELLAKQTKTGFEENLSDALILYSRSTLFSDPTDKLVYVFAALESILLKDHREPIQQNLADRMAFMIGKTPEERLQIAKTVKQVYDLRSQFVHHGRPTSDLDTIYTFLTHAWKCFLGAVQNAPKFREKKDFIDALERRKYF